MKKRLGIAALLAAMTLLAGCGGKQPQTSSGEAAPAPKTKPKVIGAALLTQTHVFYQDMVKAMEDEAEKQGIKLRLQYAEFDLGKQNNQMETFVQQAVDAIVVSPADSVGIAPAIADARAAGIPVFTVDIAAKDAEVVSHIASDNFKGGELVGERMAKLLGGKGNVAIIDHPAVESVTQRTGGFEKALAGFPEIKIVQRVPGEGQRDKALKAAQDVIEANPDLNGIFGINDDSALGALAAVEAAGRSEKIVIIGFDATPEARETIARGGALKADVAQFPASIGRTAIQTVANYLAGKEVPATVPVSVEIVDQTTLKAESGA